MANQLVELRNELAAKQNKLDKIFQQAGDDLDMELVTDLDGDSEAKVKKIQAMNRELADLTDKIKPLAEVAAIHTDRLRAQALADAAADSTARKEALSQPAATSLPAIRSPQPPRF